jgi:hypothetical protein
VLNILQCIGQPLATKNFSTPNIKYTEVRKPFWREINKPKDISEKYMLGIQPPILMVIVHTLPNKTQPKVISLSLQVSQGYNSFPFSRSIFPR